MLCETMLAAYLSSVGLQQRAQGLCLRLESIVFNYKRQGERRNGR